MKKRILRILLEVLTSVLYPAWTSRSRSRVPSSTIYPAISFMLLCINDRRDDVVIVVVAIRCTSDVGVVNIVKG